MQNFAVSYGWEGKLVRLAPVDLDKHLVNAQKWINDPEVTQHLAPGDFPMSMIAEREWMEKAAKGNETEAFFAIELLSGEHIGFTSIFQIDWKNGSGITGSMIGDKNYWSRGFGTDAALVRTTYAFEVICLRYLISATIEGNERSLRMLKKVGYVECGKYPKRIWKRGRFVDENLLYLTKEIWEGKR